MRRERTSEDVRPYDRTKSVTEVALARNAIYKTVQNGSGVKVDDALNAYTATPSATAKTPNTFLVGTARTASGGVSTSSFSGRIYSLKVRENGALTAEETLPLRVLQLQKATPPLSA